jgi:hypothetical protein
MEGVVTEINRTRGVVVIKTEEGYYSIFEMLFDTSFNIGDEVSWTEDYFLGDCDMRNITQDEILKVYFQNHNISKSNLSNQIRH